MESLLGLSTCQPQPLIEPPDDVRLREDSGPVAITVLGETDVLALGAYRIRQDDSPRLRLWEIVSL